MDDEDEANDDADNAPSSHEPGANHAAKGLSIDESHDGVDDGVDTDDHHEGLHGLVGPDDSHHRRDDREDPLREGNPPN